MHIQILGLVAGAVVVFAALPQILKIVRTKQTRDLSLPTYVLLNIGTILWIIYGILTRQTAIIIPNVIFQVFNITILYLKIKHG